MMIRFTHCNILVIILVLFAAAVANAVDGIKNGSRSSKNDNHTHKNDDNRKDNKNVHRYGKRDASLKDDPIVRQICKVLSVKSFVGLCLSDLEAIQPLGPLILNPEANETHIYPSSFLVRPRLAKDGIIDQCGDHNPAITLVRAPAKSSSGGNSRISNLADVVQNKSSYEETPDDFVSLALALDASRFHDCVEESIDQYLQEHREVDTERDVISAWRASKNGTTFTRCHEMAKVSFEQAGSFLKEANTRQVINSLLRRIVAIWGEPSIVGALMLVAGCDTDDSYDEFLNCRMVFGDVVLEANIHQRNGNDNGTTGKTTNDASSVGGSKAWKCETCDLHQYPRWFASRVTAGRVTYTMARPDCPKSASEENGSNVDLHLPTTDDLDDPYLDHASADGTKLDVVGSRYHMKRSDVVWETAEVVILRPGQTVLFSPAWFHRIVPPAYDATHAAVTIVAKYVKDPVNVSHNPKRRIPRGASAWVLKPAEIKAETTTKSVDCYNLMEIIHELRSPDLDMERGLKLKSSSISTPTAYCHNEQGECYDSELSGIS